jgi:hypothetical protein
VGVDLLALGELDEQGAVEPAGGTIVDVLDVCCLAEFCGTQPRCQSFVATKGGFPIQQQGKPIMAIDSIRLVVLGKFDEGLGHAVQAEGVELIEGGMFEHVIVS